MDEHEYRKANPVVNKHMKGNPFYGFDVSFLIQKLTFFSILMTTRRNSDFITLKDS